MYVGSQLPLGRFFHRADGVARGVGCGCCRLIRAVEEGDLTAGNHSQDRSKNGKNEGIKRDWIGRRPLPKGFISLLVAAFAGGAILAGAYCWGLWRWMR